MQNEQVPIPTKDELFRMFNSVGAMPIEMNRYSANSFPSVEISNFEDVFSLLRMQQNPLVFYQIDYYDKEEYLIDEDTITSGDFDADYDVNAFVERVKEYNAYLSKDVEFSKPKEMRLCFMLPNDMLVVFRLRDAWLQRSLFQKGMYIINNAQDAYKFLLYTDLEQLDAAEQKQMQRNEQYRRNGIKELFEFVVNDPIFEICTNQRGRRTYAKKLSERIPDRCVDTKRLLHETRICYELQDFVEKVWKLKKEGKTEYTEEVEKLFNDFYNITC